MDEDSDRPLIALVAAMRAWLASLLLASWLAACASDAGPREEGAGAATAEDDERAACLGAGGEAGRSIGDEQGMAGRGCAGDAAVSPDLTDAGAVAAQDAAGSPPDSSGGVGAACTREEMVQVIDRYLAALTAHDPSGLPRSSKLRFTENAADHALGEGLWQTAGAFKFHRNVVDAQRCSSVTQAVLEESGQQIVFALRLKLEEHLISEVETMVVRGQGVDAIWFVPQQIIDKQEPEWDEVLPPEERNTREELEALVEQYFDLFVDGDVQQYPFGEGCSRLENGLLTTRTSGCPAGITSGGMLKEQRYPAIDVERGTAVGFVVFMDTFLDLHMFKIKAGKVYRIQAVLTSQIAGGTSGWP